MAIQNMKNPENLIESDGFVVKRSIINSVMEIRDRVPIGETVNLTKHENNEVPESWLGAWTVHGYDPDGTMVLRRHA